MKRPTVIVEKSKEGSITATFHKKDDTYHAEVVWTGIESEKTESIVAMLVKALADNSKNWWKN